MGADTSICVKCELSLKVACPPTAMFFWSWEETGKPGRNPLGHRENTLHVFDLQLLMPAH